MNKGCLLPAKTIVKFGFVSLGNVYIVVLLQQQLSFVTKSVSFITEVQVTLVM